MTERSEPRLVEAEQDTGARLGTTMLYRALRGLLRDGSVEENDERPAPDLDDQQRRYYRVTPRPNRGCSARC